MIVEFFTSGLLGFWLKTAGMRPPPTPKRPHSLSASLSAIALQPQDPKRDALVAAYLANLEQQGFDPGNQGLWMQTADALLVDHHGEIRQTPASLTKVATTLAALKTWGPNHQFQTQIFVTGPISAAGVLEGDLIVRGDGDPLVVTPEAISIGNQLNQLGVRKVTGNLILQGALAVNFSQDLTTAGDRLKQMWQSSAWSPEIQQVHTWMPSDTPKPTLQIEGAVQAESLDQNLVNEPLATQPLLTHKSLSLIDLLRAMNVYSNNSMAEWFAEQMGGPTVIRNIALQTGRIAPKEMILNNGSGLEQTNKLSPRAVVGLFQGIQAELETKGLTLAQLFPVMGQDQGTLEKRHMPAATVVKTGTLWNTSGLAGIIYTQQQGPVWFAVMNRGDDYTDGFRKAQDQFLQTLMDHWGSDTPPISPVLSDTDTETRSRRALLSRFMQNDFLTH